MPQPLGWGTLMRDESEQLRALVDAIRRKLEATELLVRLHESEKASSSPAPEANWLPSPQANALDRPRLHDEEIAVRSLPPTKEPDLPQSLGRGTLMRDEHEQLMAPAHAIQRKLEATELLVRLHDREKVSRSPAPGTSWLPSSEADRPRLHDEELAVRSPPQTKEPDLPQSLGWGTFVRDEHEQLTALVDATQRKLEATELLVRLHEREKAALNRLRLGDELAAASQALPSLGHGQVLRQKTTKKKKKQEAEGGPESLQLRL